MRIEGCAPPSSSVQTSPGEGVALPGGELTVQSVVPARDDFAAGALRHVLAIDRELARPW